MFNKIYIQIVILPLFLMAVDFQTTPDDTLKIDTLQVTDLPIADGSEEDKKNEKSFEEEIKDMEIIPGLFTIYFDEKKHKVLMEISPDQFNQEFLCNITRQTGDGMMFDAGSMLGEFPFYFQQIGERIQMIQKNTSFRAENDPAANRAVEQSFSNSIFASTKVLSEPHPESGAILVDMGEIFLQDFNRVGYITGERKIKFTFDKENSYFSELKSFPENTEIDLVLHFKNAKPNFIYTLPDSRSMLHRYHYSLSTLPETDYKPRLADDRVGHFLTIFQDYSNVISETPYTRYITRWNLEKSDPRKAVSPPKKPIVFWLENTIPEQFRDAIREGILLWNDAFENAGFKNAVIVKQMPDDADWDPADVRYNTIRWIIHPESGYGVGPSRANPYTGEIYDADIRISSGYVRWFSREYDEWVTPLSISNIKQNLYPGDFPAEPTKQPSENFNCSYATGMMEQMEFGWNLLESRGTVSDENLEQFIYDGLVDLVSHEVGHTLGLRHNFKASSIYSLEQLQDKEFTEENGVTGSVMDYNPVNLSPKGQPQGSWFHKTLGTYDYWAIEYAYKPLDYKSNMTESEMLENIAGRVSDPLLQYGTDEDARGTSIWGMDPSCNVYDLGTDPMEFAELRIRLSRELWSDLLNNFEIEGNRYQKLRRVFWQGWGEYRRAVFTTTKFIGGSYIYRDHIGDQGDRIPFNLVPASDQKRALQILNDHIFHKDAFGFSPELLNKLMPERLGTFRGSVWNMQRLDFPIHNAVEGIHATALVRILNPLVLSRVRDNELRFKPGESKFTMSELFTTLRNSIWEEIYSRENINSFRRGLQRIHLRILTELVVNQDMSLPYDAVVLARADLVELQSRLRNMQYVSRMDDISKAHIAEISARVDAALDAHLESKF